MLNYTNLSMVNYDSLLNGWAAIVSIKNSVAISVDANYTLAGNASRVHLNETHFWKIYDWGLYTSPPVYYSCIPPVSGNWNINCSMNCTWKTNKNIAGNITIVGTGVLTLKSIWKFTILKPYLFIDNSCRINIGKRGRIR